MLLYKPNKKTRAQQSITNKKTIDNDDNQTLYATARDRLRNSHSQGVTADAVLVARPPFQNEFLLRDCLQREKIGFASSTDS
jgi:hypothetical protein